MCFLNDCVTFTSCLNTPCFNVAIIKIPTVPECTRLGLCFISSADLIADKN